MLTLSPPFKSITSVLSDKENLVITLDGEATVFEIKRLTNKELWLDDDITAADGEIWKLEAK